MNNEGILHNLLQDRPNYHGFTEDLLGDLRIVLVKDKPGIRICSFKLSYNEDNPFNKLFLVLKDALEKQLDHKIIPLYCYVNAAGFINDFAIGIFDKSNYIQGYFSAQNINSFSLRLATSSLDLESKFRAIWAQVEKQLVSEKKPQQEIYIIAAGDYGGINLKSLGKLGASYAPENYPVEIQDHRDKIISSLNKADPIGRLSILSGAPGTGKTYFLRGLVPECNNTKFVYLPMEALTELTGPKLVPLLIDEAEDLIEDTDEASENKTEKKRNICLILEDADIALGKRDGYSSSTVSALLNLASGIPGSAFDLRIIATTNIKKVELDPAVIRPGRLLNYLEFRNLSPKEASLSYKKLTGKDKEFTQDVPLSNIYSSADQIETPTNKMGF